MFSPYAGVICPRGDAAASLVRLNSVVYRLSSRGSHSIPFSKQGSRRRKWLRCTGQENDTEDLLHIPRFCTDNFEAFASGDCSCGHPQSAVPALLLPVADGTERGTREKVLRLVFW